MDHNKSNDQNSSIRLKEKLSLPSFSENIEAVLTTGKSVNVEGTNVIRVPFGTRQPIKQRPNRPERWATLVLPFNPLDFPTPPQAA